MVRWKPRFSLRAFLVGFVLLALAIYKIHDYYYEPHLIEVGRYPITVDYSKTLEEMIAAGKYDYVNSEITSINFPIPSDKSGSKNPEAIILHFNKRIDTEKLLKILNRKGFRPGTLPELLAFGAKYPEAQIRHWVIALGSSWQDSGGGRRVVWLGGGVGHRPAALDDRRSWWVRSARFLAFRK